MREVNFQVLDLWMECLEGDKVPLLIYSAPTGYGKTELMPHLFKIAYEHDVAARLIHASPTRSLVERIFEAKYCGRLLGVFKDIGIGRGDIKYQAMSLLAMDSKDPYFAGRVVVTTIDSLLLNQYKLCVPEMLKYYSHYEEPRSFIATSMIVYDEAHLYGGDPGVSEYSSLLYFFTSLLSASNRLRPIAVISATLPKRTMDYVRRELEATRFLRRGRVKVIVVNYGENSYVDNEFDELIKDIEWRNKLITQEELSSLVRELLSVGYRVLIVRNSPEEAVNTYDLLSRELSFKDSVLIHGRFSLRDRARLSRDLERRKLIVATQVVEVGLDLDADVLITDPCPLSQLIQRCGRVCRNLEERGKSGELHGYLYVIRNGVIQPYSEELTMKTMNLVENENLNFRDYRVCSKLLEGIYEDSGHKFLDSNRGEISKLFNIEASPRINVHDVKDMIINRVIPLVRDSLIVPIYVSDDESIDDPGAIRYGSVPISYSLLKKHPEILAMDGGVKAYFMKYEPQFGDMIIEERSIDLTILEGERYFLNIIFKGKRIDSDWAYLIALKGKHGIYHREHGLILK